MEGASDMEAKVMRQAAQNSMLYRSPLALNIHSVGAPNSAVQVMRYGMAIVSERRRCIGEQRHCVIVSN